MSRKMVERSSDEALLVTGVAGFIGYHAATRFLAEGRSVVGIDNLNGYYDPALKRARLAQLAREARFDFIEADIADPDTLRCEAVERAARQGVLHLAAQAGVRYSLANPSAYVEANLVGFANVLELCRRVGCRHLVYASTSSVYGANTRLPFRTGDNADHPTSFYAATKKANESMAHSYAHLFGLPTTGLRFFTVYGPWGRPDMALSLFADAIRRAEPIRLFDGGRHRRDYTYVDDVVAIVSRLMGRPPSGSERWDGAVPDPATSAAPWRVLNVGSGRPVQMTTVVSLLEKELGRAAIVRDEPAQPGDLPETFADIEPTTAAAGIRPSTRFEDGVSAFARWHLAHYP